MDNLLAIIDQSLTKHEKLVEQRSKDSFEYMDAKTAARYLGMKDSTFSKFIKITGLEQVLIDGMAPRYSKRSIDKLMDKNMY